MANTITVTQLQNASLDASDLETFVSDPIPKNVQTRLGGNYPNLAKLTKTLLDKGLFNATSFNTLSELQASPPVNDSWIGDGAWAVVVNDPDIAKNGNYQKIGGQWVLSKYNPSRQIAQAIDELYNQFYNSFISKSNAMIAGCIFAITDNQGNQTWLQVNTIDGGLTDVAEQAIRDKLKLRNTDDGTIFKIHTNAGVETWLQADKEGKLTPNAQEQISSELGIIKQDTSLIFAVVDTQNNRTWLEVGLDGGLTDISEQAIRKRINLTHTTTPFGVFALTDSQGNLTDLWLDNDGKVHDTVLQNWHQRLNSLNPINPILNLFHILPKLTTQNLTINKHDTYFKNGELLPILPDNDKIIFIGSSSMDNSHDEIIDELRQLNPELTMYNASFGGAFINQMSALCGSIPLKLRFTGNIINASGASNASIVNNVVFIRSRMTGTGWVQGIHGTLTANQDGYLVVFNRTTDGQVVVLNGDVDFIPEKGNEFRNATQVIWISKNNLYNPNPQIHNVEAIMRETELLLNYNASLVKRNIIITHFNNTYVSADSPARQRVNLVNHLYKLRYKNCVFDVEPIILSKQIFDDLGITRTAQDIEQQALGNLPPSLSIDAGHFNKQTNLYIASKIANFITTKQWY